MAKSITRLLNLTEEVAGFYVMKWGRLKLGDGLSVKDVAFNDVPFFCLNFLALCPVGSRLMTFSRNGESFLLLASSFSVRSWSCALVWAL